MPRKHIIHYFPVYGCMSTALIYIAVGAIAILSFLKIRHGGADESSMLAIINDFLIGKIVIVIILAGLLCYVIWRFYEAFSDPYRYGRTISGLTKRVGICLSTIVDMMIAFTAIRVLVGNNQIMLDGQPREEQEMVEALLDDTWGSTVVFVFGVVVVVVAALQLWYGITKGYKERIDLEHFNKPVQTITHIFAWIGYLARGVILGIIGFFLIKSGATADATVVVNTDKAFDFIGDHVGHFYFIAVAIGTICYGLFMVMMGIAYDIDKD
jgi:heme/copper-type cytochrome/quinol oxidase subunit 2